MSNCIRHLKTRAARVQLSTTLHHCQYRTFQVETEELKSLKKVLMLVFLWSVVDFDHRWTPEVSKVREASRQRLSVAARLSVVSLLHNAAVVPQPRGETLVRRQLQRHFFEHLTHRHLSHTHTHTWTRSLRNISHDRRRETVVPPGSGVS